MGIRACSSYEFEVRKNDTYSTYHTILTENDGGSPIDISGVETSIVLNVRKPDGRYLRLVAHKSPPDIIGGVFYQWRTGDLDVVGIYEIEPRITFGNKVYTSLERTKFKVVDTITGA